MESETLIGEPIKPELKIIGGIIGIGIIAGVIWSFYNKSIVMLQWRLSMIKKNGRRKNPRNIRRRLKRLRKKKNKQKINDKESN